MFSMASESVPTVFSFPGLPELHDLELPACLGAHQPVVPSIVGDWMGGFCMCCRRLVHELFPEDRPDDLESLWVDAVVRNFYLEKLWPAADRIYVSEGHLRGGSNFLPTSSSMTVLSAQIASVKAMARYVLQEPSTLATG